jgi:hypothetical protein
MHMAIAVELAWPCVCTRTKVETAHKLQPGRVGVRTMQNNHVAPSNLHAFQGLDLCCAVQPHPLSSTL